MGCRHLLGAAFQTDPRQQLQGLARADAIRLIHLVMNHGMAAA